jgi:hypothetical protein
VLDGAARHHNGLGARRGNLWRSCTALLTVAVALRLTATPSATARRASVTAP